MLSRGAVAWPVERRPLKFAADLETDRARAANDRVDLAAAVPSGPEVTANLFAALNALRQLAANVEQVLDEQVEAPRPLIET